jgi:hypothetical protein
MSAFRGDQWMKRPTTTLCRSSRRTLDGGDRQQRYRRKNQQAKSRKTRTAETSLSDAATTSDNADNVGEESLFAEAKNDNASNDMVTLVARVRAPL